MASVYIASALVAICLALCRASLAQDENRRTCVFAKTCICSGTRVDCKNRSLSSIPVGIPQGTTVLDLSFNQLSSLDLAKLSRLVNLQELRLHNNLLTKVPPWQSLPSSLIRLSLHHNRITYLPSQNVTKQMALQYLFLNSNRISTIGRNAFANLTSVQSMKLSRNRLKSIPVAALSHLTSLRKLDLTKNFIKSVNFRLKSLKTVTVLKLSKNKIGTILPNSFWEMSQLRELYLDNNNLTSVSTSWFFGLSNLQKLYLNNNRIRGIEKSSAPGLNWRAALILGELYLAKNELSHIDVTAFAHLSNLRRLDLGSNHIYHIAKGAFSDLNSLEVLDLSNNALSSPLESGVFTGLHKLFLLRLDGNRITWIAANAFTGLTAVTSLNLSANIITSIEENAFLDMRKLQYLYLNTTQLFCNCKLSWLPLWLSRKDLKNSVHALCLHPKPLERRSIFNLTSSDFVCDENDSKPEIIRHPQGHKILLGQNASLQCVVSQKNQSVTVNWTKDNKPLSGAYIITHAQSRDGNLVTYTSELRLSSVENKDDGYYQCVAYSTQFAPVQSKMARITVLVFPKLIETPVNVSVEAGKTFRLRCVAQGSPEPTLSWQKDGGSSFPAANDRRMGFQHESNVYEIRNAKDVDTGKYTCNATNEAGSVEATAYVTVLKAPSFVRNMRKEVEVSVGDSVVLECYTSGAPKPFIAWFKDNTRVKGGSHVVLTESGQLLVIAQVEEEDAGNYACEATNSQGSKRRTVQVTIQTEKCTSVLPSEKENKSKYVKYDKKTFLGIIVVVAVSSIVVTSMVWVFIQYNSLSCGKKRAARRRSQYAAPFGADCSDESNCKAFQHEDISYIPLKLSSSSSTQTSRESPRSTATFLTSSESAQGPCIVANLAASSENASGSEEKSSAADNVSSENSLKGSHSSLTSSCPSDSCLPSYEQVVTSAQIHVSDSDSEKNRPISSETERNDLHSEDPGGGISEHKLDIPECQDFDEETSLPLLPLLKRDGNEVLPEDVTTDACVTVYPLTNSDTSCVADRAASTSVQT